MYSFFFFFFWYRCGFPFRHWLFSTSKEGEVLKVDIVLNLGIPYKQPKLTGAFRLWVLLSGFFWTLLANLLFHFGRWLSQCIVSLLNGFVHLIILSVSVWLSLGLHGSYILFVLGFYQVYFVWFRAPFNHSLGSFRS